jgi:radical SAM superfamily enzyme YgiQ (UPF0313 family)
MRVLLVAPTALDFEGRPIKQRKLYLPGLTLPMLAAVTPADVSITIVNETVHDIPYDRRWDLVGLTGMGSGVVRAWQIADEFRRRQVPVVMGGIAASLARPEMSLAHADSLVLGEAEETWPRVLADAAAGRLRSVYPMERRPPIESLPLPRFDLLDRAKLGPWRPVQATRGCPFPCTFCSVTAFFGGGYRKRPVAEVVRDVRHAKAHGTRHIAFIDDNIAVDFRYSAELFEALVPERIVWMSQCSLHIAERPELLRLARRSGCRLLSFGIESTSAESLAPIEKEWNRPERYREAIAAIRRHGIDVSTEMIVGLDGDDPSVFERTYRFIVDNRISVPRVHIMTPVPGTPLYDRMEREGRLLSSDFGRFSGGQVVFRPLSIRPEELQDGYWRLYQRLFTWPGIVRRLARNPARLGPFMRAFVTGVNLHYRRHVQHRICPGIV